MGSSVGTSKVLNTNPALAAERRNLYRTQPMKDSSSIQRSEMCFSAIKCFAPTEREFRLGRCLLLTFGPAGTEDYRAQNTDWFVYLNYRVRALVV
jgi:hypothetical protein